MLGAIVSLLVSGLVIGLLTASNASGQLVFLPLLASLAEHIGAHRKG